ncbi:hypothetical protein HCH_03952 [Hahella chejuensis KCTC 2396]|uniref:Uncharacterized protein n=1 Tax=Hahella chejuensis (strain KCTC 2396) TaxID=349521 RepID=Q2SFA3_HAHCH|nr:hypothetical protein HCH_03952 [Hahella chejuensis KCTC 2396]
MLSRGSGRAASLTDFILSYFSDYAVLQLLKIVRSIMD